MIKNGFYGSFETSSTNSIRSFKAQILISLICVEIATALPTKTQLIFSSASDYAGGKGSVTNSHF
jgi:hypothetical protein